MNHKASRRMGGGRGGFTLLELIIAMGMAMLVLAGVVMLYSTSNRSYVKQDNVVKLEQNIRSAMEIMSHEIRMAGYIPLDNRATGTNPINTDVSGKAWSDGTLDKIEEAAATRLTFVADLNSDDRAETVRYFLNGATLTRESWEYVGGAWSTMIVGGGSVPLADNVVSLQFVYTFATGVTGTPNDSDSSPDNDRDDIRQITISMTAQTATVLATVGGGGGGVRPSATLQTNIKLRNMGLPEY